MKGLLTRLSAMLRSGETSSYELTKKYIAEIEKGNPSLNAYVHLTFERALKDAETADKMLKNGVGGALTGIPYALKDNICTDGLLTTCCSRILRDFKPYYNAAVVEKLNSVGAVLLGKTNMDEFAMGSTSETSCYGAPLNPRNLSYVTGGSSGGSAAAVAANIAPYALGSDTGGSIRQPAAFCGVVGFKPTYGAVSRYGLIAYGSSLDQIGPITHTVSDAALVYDAIRGADVRDMTSAATDAAPTVLDPEVKGIKIALADEFFEGLDGEMKALIEGVVKKYEAYGAEVSSVSIPSLKTALPVYYIIACAEASSNLGRYDGIRYGFRAADYSDVDDMVVRTRTQGFGKEVQKRIMLGTYVLSSGYFDAYYKKACLLREKLKGEMDKVFEKFDLLIAPTAPVTAFKRGYSGGNAIETYHSDVCTVPVNIAGLPAISIPCGKTKTGLPVGMQIIGDRFADSAVLSAAYFCEAEGVCGEEIYEGGVRL